MFWNLLIGHQFRRLHFRWPYLEVKSCALRLVWLDVGRHIVRQNERTRESDAALGEVLGRQLLLLVCFACPGIVQLMLTALLLRLNLHGLHFMALGRHLFDILI